MLDPGQPGAAPVPSGGPVPSVASVQPAGASPWSVPVPPSPADAVAMAEAALAYLTSADLALAPADTQAECLLGLARVESLQVVARSDAVTAFGACRGYEADGQYSPKSWLRWQARITSGAATASVAWARRLRAHPAVRTALATQQISVSWAQQICAWTDALPEEVRADADAVLLAAAVDAADLAVLARLAEQITALTAPPDSDDGKDFADRSLALDLTFGGAGRLVADLTPECAAAVMAMLESLAKKADPEDDRSLPQRQHDALEEACRRLAGSGWLPERAGQPTQILHHMTLDQLLGLHGQPPAGAGTDAGTGTAASAGTGAGTPSWLRGLNTSPDGPGGGRGTTAAWAGGLAGGPGGRAGGMTGRGAGDGQPGRILDPITAGAYSCDAQITTIVTGHVDKVALALSVRTFLAAAHGTRSCPVGGCEPEQCATDHHRPMPMMFDELMDLFLRQAIEVLSGPTGLAAQLRSAAGGPAAYGVSLPLDVGAVTATIPPHLRRAVINRDRHCAFPGCHQPPAACQVHHLIPRSQGGTTSLTNLVLLCPFHHLVMVHRWGWTLALNGDGTTTATSPDGQRTFHSHSPPTATPLAS